MEHLLLALLLLVAVIAARYLLRRPATNYADEPQEYVDIYQSTLINLLKKTSGCPLGFQRRSQRFADQTQPIGHVAAEAPKDYAPWDGQARDALDEALILSTRP